MKYEILGIKIDKVNIEKVTKTIKGYLEGNKKRIIFYVNAHSLNISYSNSSFKEVMNKANLIYCGGLGPVIMAQALDNTKLYKTTTPDFIFDIFRYMEIHNKSVFFLGSEAQTLKKMTRILSKKFPNLIIKGTCGGYFSNGEDNKIISKINNLKPDLLLVGMGSPKQEIWIIDNYKKINAQVFWSVGAVFEILSGKYKRLPKVFNDYGFEWIFRLIQEPKRLWRRYLKGNIKIITLIINSYFSKKRL